MIYKVVVSEQADIDLRDIYKYIAFVLHSKNNAEGQLNRLEKDIMGLERMPERFHRYKKEPWYSRGLRVLSVDNYCVFYIPETKSRVVTIIRVMYSHRDMDRALKRNTNQSRD